MTTISGASPAEQLAELELILRRTSWTPAQRVAYALLRLDAQPQPGEAPGTAWRVTDGKGKRLAALTGLSERSAREVVQSFADAGLVEKHVERSVATVNRYGEVIPARAASPERGDRRWFDAETVLALPARLPELPVELPRSVNTERSRRTAAEQRRRFADLESQVTELLAGESCPSCGSEGTLRGEVTAVCTDCGCRMSAGELDAMLKDAPDAEAENFAAGYPDGVSCVYVPPAARGETAWAWQAQGEQFAEAARRSCQTAEDYAAAWRTFTMSSTEPDVLDEPAENFAASELELFSAADEEPWDALVEAENFAASNDEDDERQTLQLLSSDTANFAASKEETRRGGDSPGVLPPADGLESQPAPEVANFADGRVRLRGADIIRFLRSQGIERFTRAYAPGVELPWKDKDGDPAISKGKEGTAGWKRGCSAADAIAWLEQGGNVGVLCAGLIVTDADAGAQHVARLPELAGVAAVVRADAPERAKWLLRGAGRYRKWDDGQGAHGEVLAGEYHAIVAGRHASGAGLELLTGIVPEIDAAGLERLMARFPPTSPTLQPILGSSSPTSPTPQPTAGKRDWIREGIAWWNEQPGNIALVDDLLSKLPRSGKHVAVRPDDGSPSAYPTARGDALKDFGTGEIADRYELYCRLTGTDKRKDKWRVANEYRATLGKPPLRIE